jgi:hypothetical protein
MPALGLFLRWTQYDAVRWHELGLEPTAKRHEHDAQGADDEYAQFEFWSPF